MMRRGLLLATTLCRLESQHIGGLLDPGRNQCRPRVQWATLTTIVARRHRVRWQPGKGRNELAAALEIGNPRSRVRRHQSN
jgi:hypothetical protein